MHAQAGHGEDVSKRTAQSYAPMLPQGWLDGCGH